MRPISTVPSCNPSIMAVSVPSWEFGNTLISTRPAVTTFTSSAKPEAATCQLCAGGRTWPSFNTAAWAGAAARMASAATDRTTVLIFCMPSPPRDVRLVVVKELVERRHSETA